MTFETTNVLTALALVAPPCLAAIGGVLAAQAAGPIWCDWPSRPSELQTRLAALTRRAPGPSRLALGTVLLGAILLGGGLTAYATTPSQARAELSQSLRATVENRDGGAGYAPGGAAAGPARVATVRMPQEPSVPALPAGLLNEIASGRWDGRPAWGLNQDQTERLIAYDLKRDRALTDFYANNFIPGQQGSQIPGRPSEAEILGPDTDDYRRLAASREAYRAANYQAEMATPFGGPSSIHVRADEIPIQAITAAGADPRGVWVLGPADDDGGRTMTRNDSAVYASGALTSAMAIANWGNPG